MDTIENANMFSYNGPGFIDEKIIERLSIEAMGINPYNDSWYLYNKFYMSKYIIKDVSKQEIKLKKHIRDLKKHYGDKIEISNQGLEYEWVMINYNNLGDIAYRFYLGVNPKNMHKIVEILSTEFLSSNIAVALKYQQKLKLSQCDRIIIYCDYDSREKIENIIFRVYQANSTYFEESERAQSWIYETRVPNVYITPETKGFSYGMRFAEIMLEAKAIFSYLNNVTFYNNHIVANSKEDIECMKSIIKSLLSINGLLFSCDKKSVAHNKKQKIYYDYNLGILIVYIF